MMDVILSTPMTNTFLCFPDSMNCEPVDNAYKKPEHAALTSKLQAFFMPTLSQTMLAVLGKGWSGVTVPTITNSISKGSMPFFSSKVLTAAAAISELAPSFMMRRSLMPVRLMIHSSEVSTNLAKSSFDKICSGT